MIFRFLPLTLCALLLAAACGDDDGQQTPDPCEDVDCGFFGVCAADGDSATCNCDLGFHDEGLSCVRDNRSPSFTNLPYVSAVRVFEPGQFDVDATDVDANTQLTYEITGTSCSFTSDIDASSGLVQWTCGDEESCEVFLRVSDDYDPPSTDTDTLYIECRVDIPYFVSTPLLLAREHELYQHEIECKDPFGDELTLSLLPANTCPGTLEDDGGGRGTFLYRPGELDGGTSCTLGFLCASDTASATQVAGLTIVEVNAAPALTNLPASATAHWGEAGFYDVTDSDSSDIPANAMSLSLSGNTCSFTPYLDGNQQIRFTCGDVETCTLDVTVQDDGSPPLYDKETLTLQCVNEAPVLSDAADTATVGVPYTYDAQCTDGDLDAVTLSVGGSDTCGGTLTPVGSGHSTYAFTPASGTSGSTCVVQVTCSDTQAQTSELVTVSIQ